MSFWWFMFCGFAVAVIALAVIYMLLWAFEYDDDDDDDDDYFDYTTRRRNNDTAVFLTLSVCT